MGSRIMHLIIANQIAGKTKIQDKQTFLLGGIAPDAVHPKVRSHFYKGSDKDFSTKIEFEKFFKKYPEKTDYLLGYYTHLIADHLWIHGFYFGWLKNRMNADETLYQRYHGDFRVLNAKLLNYYQLDHGLLNNLDFNNIPDLDEVKKADVEAFVPYVLEDMNYPKEHLDAELNVFTFQQIIGYIESCAHLGLIRLKELGVDTVEH
ncbi:zinc dependent phospholipase C family protein [Ornithinibacillus halotolerans]|uniref:Phospholipase C/D domain-containing protein n=1 Tax=Ornithinibacillus halotolerans TaxID=1274357 RepID=A0A916WAB8_9BACI|nr:zinc dependent phospholipase C family protein [Ornithinibacillus halotolerans]GGA80877.1 hypothetical protein GCM10008025_25310 [Ornithinibacillus halotolerans]